MTWQGPRLRLVMGLGRPQERRLLHFCREDPGLKVASRHSSAPDAIRALRGGSADVALLDEDLHLLGNDQLQELSAEQLPAVVLTRDPGAQRWQGPRLYALAADAEPAQVLEALRAAFRGEAQTCVRATPVAAARPAEPAGSRARGDRLQVLAFWGGAGSPGRTTAAINCCTLLGSSARTILVDLDLTGAGVAAHLDGGGEQGVRRVRLIPNIVQLAAAAPESYESWSSELQRLAQGLGQFSPWADVLAGVPRPRLRSAISSAFVERLISALRARYDYVLIDLGDEPLGDGGRESAVAAAALRTADQVLVVCPPDGPGLHQTAMALAEAQTLLDRGRAGLVVNRYERRYHEAGLAGIEEALGLPVVCVLPQDHAVIQHALARGVPAVCDPRSRLRRPLLELAERIDGGELRLPTPRTGTRRLPWGRLQTAASGALIGMTGGGR
jgi:MinD-like ATPase involved in chromosome partitioning or flagellar assembly